MSYKWRVFAVAGFFNWAGAVDNGAWPVLLPTIAGEFHVTTALVAWVLVTFALGMAGTGLIVGHVGDVAGHKRLAALGFATEAGTLALALLSPALWPILGLRFLQGIGRATGLNNMQAMAIAQFSPAERGLPLGLSSALAALGLMTGPPYAGFVAEHFGWRVALAGVVALYIVQTSLVLLVTKEALVQRMRLAAVLRRLDWPGAVSLLLAISTMLLSAQLLRGVQTRFLGALVMMACVVAIVAAVRFERRSTSPVLNLQLFKSPVFTSAAAGVIVFNLVAGASTFLFPFYMQRGLGWSLAQSGLVLTALYAVQLWGAPLSGALSDKIGARPVQAAGAIVVLLGLLLGMQLGNAAAPWSIAIVLFTLGVGISLYMPPNNKIIYSAVPRTALATASAVPAVGRYIGQSLGTALGAMMLAAQAGRGVPSAFHASMITVALIVGIGSALTLLYPALAGWLRRPNRSSQSSQTMFATEPEAGTDRPEHG